MHQAIHQVRINVFRERYNSMQFDVMQLASPVSTSYLRHAFNFQRSRTIFRPFSPRNVRANAS